jgi:hypothetical protein
LGSYISKEYAPELFRLLHLYKDISASEAASRLSLHIRTVQDFFDALHEAGIVRKEEVLEGKRPYFRYQLLKDVISMEIRVSDINPPDQEQKKEHLLIRERKNANVRYSISRNNLYFSNVSIWIGSGRERREKKVNLTHAQGRFLYNLPFPDAGFMSIEGIMKNADVEDEYRAEVLDIVELMIQHDIIETESGF